VSFVEILARCADWWRRSLHEPRGSSHRAIAPMRSWHTTVPVTAHMIPNQAPTAGTYTLTVNYNNTAPRYIDVNLCTADWDCFASGLVLSCSCRNRFSTCDPVLQLRALVQLLPLERVDRIDRGCCGEPWNCKHSWQVYSAKVGSAYIAQSC